MKTIKRILRLTPEADQVLQEFPVKSRGRVLSNIITIAAERDIVVEARCREFERILRQTGYPENEIEETMAKFRKQKPPTRPPVPDPTRMEVKVSSRNIQEDFEKDIKI